ncbi:MAG: sigma 54-interacting transcriptional regulator [Myxococcota bacterium]|nr:sigma 54-interacting transcriptional regulator [Myxococcota bacterium]
MSHDRDATLSSSTSGGTSKRGSIVARVLAHPDVARVGDFAPLFDAERAAKTSLSRLSPEFRTPDGRRARPLESPRITRAPLEIERHGEGLMLRRPAEVPVEVNGQPLHGERQISREELDAGVVILFGKHLALWLGWFDPFIAAPAVPLLVGESTVMHELRTQIHRLAALEDPVLIRGETGVGKELVAEAIHRLGSRVSSSYVAVNLSGIPPAMAASELFGHKRGAFTGAVDERKGYFSQAAGGTLFLDEIGEVSGEVQVLLLRAIQHGVIQPLGGRTQAVDVRLIAATDSDLESAVARKEFREPLLRRFPFSVWVPPLRERRDDVGMLFFRLLEQGLSKMGESFRLDRGSADATPWVPASYVARLAIYGWPGNVRELANVALNFALENRGEVRARVTENLLRLVPAPTATPLALPEPEPEPGTKARRAEDISDDELIAAMTREEFVWERAAKTVGVSKGYLYARLGKALPKASALSLPEIRTALESCGGQHAEAARLLRVSLRGLRLRLGREG